MTAQRVTHLDELIPLLPREVLANFFFEDESRSRVVLHNDDASLVFAFPHEGGSMEVRSFSRESGEFETFVVESGAFPAASRRYRNLIGLETLSPASMALRRAHYDDLVFFLRDRLPVWRRPVAYLPVTLDPATRAHLAIVRHALEELGAAEVHVLVNSLGPKDCTASVDERVAMGRALFAPFGRRVIVRAEPFRGKEGYLQTLRLASEFPILTLTGADGYERVPEAVLAREDREWVIYDRPGQGAAEGPLRPRTRRVTIGGIEGMSSTQSRERLARGEAAPALTPEVAALVGDIYLEPAIAERARRAASYHEFCRDFHDWLREAYPGAAVRFSMPPFKAIQTTGAWLDKCILAAAKRMVSSEADHFARHARAVFAARRCPSAVAEGS